MRRRFVHKHRWLSRLRYFFHSAWQLVLCTWCPFPRAKELISSDSLPRLFTCKLKKCKLFPFRNAFFPPADHSTAKPVCHWLPTRVWVWNVGGFSKIFGELLSSYCHPSSPTWRHANERLGVCVLRFPETHCPRIFTSFGRERKLLHGE